MTRPNTAAIQSGQTPDRHILDRYDRADLVGISCIADGPDSIFAEEMLAHGGRLIVVIPAASYRDGPPQTRHALYDELLGKAGQVIRLPHQASGPKAHLEASERLVDNADLLVAVWDGQPARGLGDTADVVTYAHNTGRSVRVIWPAGARRP